MNDLNKLLDKIKETRSIASDNALAAAIGVSRQRVSAWRHGTNLPDPVACATIAGLSGEPLARVLGIVGEARAISREEKAVWHKLAASAAALFIVLGATTLPGVGARDAQANAQSASGHDNGDRSIHYAKLWSFRCLPRRPCRCLIVHRRDFRLFQVETLRFEADNFAIR